MNYSTNSGAADRRFTDEFASHVDAEGALSAILWHTRLRTLPTKNMPSAIRIYGDLSRHPYFAIRGSVALALPELAGHDRGAAIAIAQELSADRSPDVARAAEQGMYLATQIGTITVNEQLRALYGVAREQPGFGGP